MPIIANDPTKAQANWTALTAAKGIVQLPRGRVHVSEEVIHGYSNSGLRLLGNDTEIVSPKGHALCVYGRTFDQVPGNLKAGQVGFVAHRDGDLENRYTKDRQQVRFTGKLPTLAPIPAPHDPADRVWQMSPLLKRAQVLPDMDNHSIGFVSKLATLPKVGDIVRITDGRRVNEMIFDVRKIHQVFVGGSVIFDQELSRPFLNAAAVFTQEPHDITYSGIRFVSPVGPVELKGASYITFDDCEFSDCGYPDPNDGRGFTAIINCAYLDFIRSTIRMRMQIGASHDIRLLDCDTNHLGGEEDAHDVRVTGGTLKGRCDAQDSDRWFLTGITSTAADIMLYADSELRNVTNAAGQIVIRGSRAKLVNVDTAGKVWTQWAPQAVAMRGVRYGSLAIEPTADVSTVDCSQKSEIIPPGPP